MTKSSHEKKKTKRKQNEVFTFTFSPSPLTKSSESELFVVSEHCFLTPPIVAELASTAGSIRDQKKKKEKRKRKLTMTFDKANWVPPTFHALFWLEPTVTFKLL